MGRKVRLCIEVDLEVDQPACRRFVKFLFHARLNPWRKRSKTRANFQFNHKLRIDSRIILFSLQLTYSNLRAPDQITESINVGSSIPRESHIIPLTECLQGVSV